MSVEGFDHLAITVADVEATVAFYGEVLGAEPMYLEEFRAGKIPIVMMQVGANRINVHPGAAPASPHARLPTPGSVDLCFRWGDTIAAAQAHLAELRHRGHRRPRPPPGQQRRTRPVRLLPRPRRQPAGIPHHQGLNRRSGTAGPIGGGRKRAVW